MRVALSESLLQMGYPTLVAASAEEALVRCCGQPLSAVISDMKMEGMSGLDLFHEMARRKVRVPVILMSAFGTIEVAVAAMRSGVVDYLPKPFSQEALAETLHRALPDSPPPIQAEDREEVPRLAGRSGGRVFLTQDAAMLCLLAMVESVARGEASVLIEGESGTGKELIARLVHEQSPRARRPFVALNCAAVPEALLESELFGYEKGAFTGALVRKPGRFELAHTGTILLDEVSELPLCAQAKLLRVIQEREVDPLGGRGAMPIDVRVIATSNRPLLEEVKAGRFREDLYYRLSVFPMRIPPLRARKGDIAMLATHFAGVAASRNRKSVPRVGPAALALLGDRPWKGNARELENVIERVVLLTDGDEIAPWHLRFDGDVPCDGATGSVGSILRDAERVLIMKTLEKEGGNRTHAARTLGISVRTLRNKLREYHALPTTALSVEAAHAGSMRGGK